MRADQVQGLMEAYSQVYETPEVLNEEVVGENVEQIDEVWDSGKSKKYTPSQLDKSMSNLGKSAAKNLGFGGSTSGPRTYMGVRTGGSSTGSAKPSAAPTRSRFAGARDDAFKKAQAIKGSPVVGSKPAPTATAKPTPAGGSVPKPAGAKPPATPVAKPATPAPGTKDAGPESIKPKTPNPLLAGGEIRRMQQASQMRQKGIDVTSNQLKSAERTKPTEVKKESIDVFDLVKGHLLDEGYAETEENALVMMSNMSEEWRESIIMELTGGKGHPGYKAGSKDHGPMQDGHPADSNKRRAVGGTMSMRHGYHLDDMDDEDDDEDDLESVVKQQSRDSREATRKPLRDKVKAARKKLMKKEGIELEDILALNRKMERVYEAQRARENPEDHDKEEKKKYEKVRGERTPMPPRGDKRREDFEKWYRANVR
jgi:hypothetical protein